MLDHADRHAEEAVDAAHPFRVAPRQVVVDGDDVDAFAFERVEIRGQRRDERLAFTGFHFGDGAVVQHDPADQLDVVVPHLQHAFAGFAHHGKRLGLHVVDGLAVGEPGPELDRLGAQLLVGEGLDRGFEGVDFGDARTQLLEVAVVLTAEDFS